jgi:hypothetical protein
LIETPLLIESITKSYQGELTLHEASLELHVEMIASDRVAEKMGYSMNRVS